MAVRSATPVTLDLPPPVQGINLATSVDKLQPLEAENIVGYEFDEYGVLGAPRPPKDLGTPVGANVRCLAAHIWQKAGTTPKLIAHFSDGTLRYSSDFHTTSTTASWTTIDSSVSTTVPISFVTWVDKVWMAINASPGIASWDGTTYTIHTGSPNAQFIVEWRDCLWASGTNDRVYSSDPGDGTSWPAVNFVDVAKGTGLGISGLHAVETSLVVFKLGRTYIIYDPVEFTNRLIDSDKGCISNQSIVTHNGQTYFASHLGICRFLGDGPSQIVSDKIQPLFRDIYQYGSSLGNPIPDYALDMRICGYSYANFVGWHLPGDQVQHVKYFPDLPETPWLFGREATYSSSGVFVSMREPLLPQQLYLLGGYAAGSHLYREYGGLLSTAQNCEWRSSWTTFNDATVEKYLSLMEILHRGTITVIINRDFKNEAQGGEDSETVGTNLSSPLDKLSTSTVYLDNYGKAFQVVVRSTAADEVEQMLGSGLYAGELGVARFQSGVAMVRLRGQMLTEMWR